MSQKRVPPKVINNTVFAFDLSRLKVKVYQLKTKKLDNFTKILLLIMSHQPVNFGGEKN